MSQSIVAILRCALIAGVTTLFEKSLKPKLQVTNILEVVSKILQRTKGIKCGIFSFIWVSGEDSEEMKSATNRSE